MLASDPEKTLSRREFLKLIFGAAGGILLTSCGIKNTPSAPPTETPAPREPGEDEVIDNIRQEVKRLALTLPQGNQVREIYTAQDLTSISPIFASPLEYGALIHPSMAETFFHSPVYSAQEKFSYLYSQDGSTANYLTLESAKLRVLLPQNFPELTDEVKLLILRKEANTIIQWEAFSRYVVYPFFTSNGTITKLDPTVEDRQISSTLAWKFLTENPNILKRYDYAGYIPIMSGVGRILASGNQQAIAELKVSNADEIYTLAQQQGINFEGVTEDPAKFIQLAYSDTSPWVAIIDNPNVAGPVQP